MTARKCMCLWDTLKLYRHHIYFSIRFFFILLLGYIQHTLCAVTMKHEIYTEIVQYDVKHQDMRSIYTLVIVLFLSPHYSEFLFLDIVHDRISGFTSCRRRRRRRRRKNVYRTPSNQWIPLPYYGCLLYIKKKKFRPYHHLPYIVQWL